VHRFKRFVENLKCLRSLWPSVCWGLLSRIDKSG